MRKAPPARQGGGPPTPPHSSPGAEQKQSSSSSSSSALPSSSAARSSSAAASSSARTLPLWLEKALQEDEEPSQAMLSLLPSSATTAAAHSTSVGAHSGKSVESSSARRGRPGASRRVLGRGRAGAGSQRGRSSDSSTPLASYHARLLDDAMQPRQTRQRSLSSLSLTERGSAAKRMEFFDPQHVGSDDALALWDAGNTMAVALSGEAEPSQKDVDIGALIDEKMGADAPHKLYRFREGTESLPGPSGSADEGKAGMSSAVERAFTSDMSTAIMEGRASSAPNVKDEDDPAAFSQGVGSSRAPPESTRSDTDTEAGAAAQRGKRALRLMRNRESAMRSRSKRKANMENLEQRNWFLHQTVQELEIEREQLLSRLNQLGTRTTPGHDR